MNKLIKIVRQERLLVSLAAVIWGFLFLTTITKTYLFFQRHNLELEIGYIILRSFLIWGGLALFAPVIIFLAHRFPLDKALLKNIAAHILFSLLLVPLHAFLFHAVMMLVYDKSWDTENFLESFPIIMSWLLLIGPLAYWLIIGIYYLRRFYERYKERQLRNAHLEAELASIRLHILKIQLHPHFLFNTLHNINSLIYEAPATAQRVLSLLKRFLQISISRVDKQIVPLADELEFTGTYLEIEKTRFSNRLQIETDIDKQTFEALVPSFLLQPLVENAVKHGISQKMEPGMIRITSRKNDEALVITVEDDGPGLQQPAGKYGVGLENIRQRLSQLYRHSKFELLPSALGGLKVYIEIPFKSVEKRSGYEKKYL